MAKRTVDPDLVTIGEVSATPMRERGEDGDRRYWRARGPSPDRLTVWTGWATRDEVVVEVAKAIGAGIPVRRKRHAVARTVGDLLRKWVEYQEERQKGDQIAARSLVNYRQSASHWRSVFDDVLTSALSRALVEDTLSRWRAEGVSARSAKQLGDVLAMAVKWGKDRGHCPALDLSRLEGTKGRADEYVNCDHTPDRAEAMAVIDRILPGRDRELIELIAWTGARVGEAAALRVESWESRSAVLVIHGQDEERDRRGKVARRRFPVQGELEQLLARLTLHRTGPDPIVVGLPRDCSDMVRRALERACAANMTPRFTAHGLRRMVAMELLDDCGDPKAVSMLTGHSVEELLRSYVRPKPERLRDIVARTHGARGKVVQFPGASGTGSGHTP